MARPPVFPTEEKVQIVLSILAGEITVAEAARRAKVSEQSVGNWKRQFLEAGKAGLAAGKARPSTREQQLEAEVTELTQALGEGVIAGRGVERGPRRSPRRVIVTASRKRASPRTAARDAGGRQMLDDLE